MQPASCSLPPSLPPSVHLPNASLHRPPECLSNASLHLPPPPDCLTIAPEAATLLWRRWRVLLPCYCCCDFLRFVLLPSANNCCVFLLSVFLFPASAESVLSLAWTHLVQLNVDFLKLTALIISAMKISRAALTPEFSYIASPAASWLDDFLVWLSPEAFSCCRKFPNATYCPPDDQPPCCAAGEDNCGVSEICKDCTTCFLHSELIGNRPSTTQFREKLPWFLNSLPSADCAKGGHGAYTNSVDLEGYDSGVIQASEFRTYHTPLNKQNDFVNAMKAARDFAARASDSLKISVFPYSVFYIFFEQYLDIWRTTLINLSLALGAVFIVCLAITCSLWASAMILLVLAMIIVDMMGLMSLLSIQLNAVSVVNLVMSAGIAVEFCVHITHAFSVSEGSRAQRTKEALTTMGASIFSGITVTKFVGVLVLFFARSEIFEVYYFRMYFSLVILGFLHGLIFLPVLLSLCGPPSIKYLLNNDEQNDTSTSNSTEQNLGTYKMENGQQSDP